MQTPGNNLPHARQTSPLLWLGFYILILIFSACVAIVSLRLLSVQEHISALTAAHDRIAVARELDIRTTNFALSVHRSHKVAYVPQQSAAAAAATVEQILGTYDDLVTTSQQRELVAQFTSRWRDFERAGRAIAGAAEEDTTALESFMVLRSGLEAVIQELKAEGATSYNSRKELVIEDARDAMIFVVLTLATGLLAALLAGAVVGRRVMRIEQQTKAAERTAREHRELLQVTLASVGDAIITTDVNGLVTYLNPVAASLTGWELPDATGKRLDEVFRIFDEKTRRVPPSPAERALREGVIVGLSDTILIGRDGRELPIDDSAAPIRGADGEVVGCILVFRDVSEQRSAQRILEQRESRQAAMLETALDCIITINHEGTILEFNAAAEETFGYKREEAIGAELADLIIPPALREQHRRGLSRCVATGEGTILNRRLELTALRADGHEFPVEIAITRIVEDGPPLFTAYLRDITEHKQTEAVQAHFRALFEAAPGPYVVLTPDRYEIVAVSDAYLKATKTDRPALMGKLLNEVFPDDPSYPGAEGVRNLLASLQRVKETLNADAMAAQRLPVRRPDDQGGGYEERWWSPINSPVLGPDGELAYIIHRVEDVTAYVLGSESEVQRSGALRTLETRAQQMEADIVLRAHELQRINEQLRRSEERQKFILDSMPQKVFAADSAGRLNYFNSQWPEIAGLALEESHAWNWEQFVHTDDLAEHLRSWEVAVTTGSPFECEQRMRGADGSYRWHFTRAWAMRDEHGAISMWLGTSTDIHAQKQSADALRRLSAELAEADRRKNDFLAMLAHELRGPLAPTNTAVEILLQSGENEPSSPAYPAIRVIQRQIAQMTRLIEDLIDVSRVSQGKITLRRERVTLASIVDDAVETVTPLFARRNLEFAVKQAPSPIYVNVDAARITQVIGNLLGNAAKFTPEGGKVWLTVEHNNDEAVIRVRDNGIGISRSDLDRIFDLFSQLDTTLERTQTGLGIGLTLAKTIIELHGGSIEVYSPGVGKGAQFTVRLQSVESDMTDTPKTEESGRDTETAPQRILVVDDNIDAATSLAMLLEMQGHEVATAHDGIAAVEKAAEFNPDVVLLDIGLPRLNGYEAAPRIRALPGSSDLVLIALTGWGQESDRKRSAEAGFDHHLVKPVKFAEVTALLARTRVPADPVS